MKNQLKVGRAIFPWYKHLKNLILRVSRHLKKSTHLRQSRHLKKSTNLRQSRDLRKSTHLREFKTSKETLFQNQFIKTINVVEILRDNKMNFDAFLLEWTW